MKHKSKNGIIMKSSIKILAEQFNMASVSDTDFLYQYRDP
mgnify:CR=1 FL=1